MVGGATTQVWRLLPLALWQALSLYVVVCCACSNEQRVWAQSLHEELRRGAVCCPVSARSQSLTRCSLPSMGKASPSPHGGQTSVGTALCESVVNPAAGSYVGQSKGSTVRADCKYPNWCLRVPPCMRTTHVLIGACVQYTASAVVH